MGILFKGGLETFPSIFWNKQYTSNGLAIYPHVNSGYFGVPVFKSSIYDVDPGVYSALGNRSIGAGEKKLISYYIDADAEQQSPYNYAIGIGNTNLLLNDALGNDGNGIGINNLGEVWYNNILQNSGYPFYGTVGDIIDLAVYEGHSMWYRINGGPWNGDQVADPATNTNGISISELSGTTIYPAISIYGGQGPSQFSVLPSTIFGLPSGYTQIAGDRPANMFSLTSDMIDSQGWYGSVCGTNEGSIDSNFTGFTVTNGQTNTYCGVGVTLANSRPVVNAYESLGMDYLNNYNGYIASVQWASGSTITSGYAKISFTGNNNNRFNVEPLDPTDSTNFNNDGNSNNGKSLAGTFLFPASFTILSPLDNKGGWC